MDHDIKITIQKMSWMRNIKFRSCLDVLYEQDKRGVATGTINGIIAAPLFFKTCLRVDHRNHSKCGVYLPEISDHLQSARILVYLQADSQEDYRLH